MEVGALRGGRRGATLLRGEVLGAGGGGRRVGVGVRVQVHVVLVFAQAAVARSFPAPPRRGERAGRVVGGVVAVADVGAAGGGGRGRTADRVVGSDGEEARR